MLCARSHHSFVYTPKEAKSSMVANTKVSFRSWQTRSFGGWHVTDVPVKLPECIELDGLRMTIEKSGVHSPRQGRRGGPIARNLDRGITVTGDVHFGHVGI